MPQTACYGRQAVLPEVVGRGHRVFSRSKAVVVGMGALGCMLADLLARAGVGHLWLVDRDLVELGHLLRQILFSDRAGSALLADAEGHHFTLFPDGRALIRGVKDASGARSVYGKYVGV